MYGAEYIAALTGALAAYGTLEAAAQQRRLKRIKHRVHVNGTRGKSSVCRLIAGGLRSGGLKTFSKVTGTEARMIMNDGAEVPVFRPARANVIEQIRVGRVAANNGADALVMECMALQPRLQWLCERWFMRATHGVITNARPDHLDVMGPDEIDVALALAAMTPVKGTLYTADQSPENLDVFRHAAADRGSRLVIIGDEAVAEITAADLGGFSYTEHPDNLALALRVCGDIGISREDALRGMWAARPDSGAMTEHPITLNERSVMFINGFAANDPESTAHIWAMGVKKHAERDTRLALVNCRVDRGHRSKQLGETVAAWPQVDHYFVIGTGTHVFLQAALANGLTPPQITALEGADADVVLAAVAARVAGPTMAMGVGNIGGVGMALMERVEALDERHKEP